MHKLLILSIFFSGACMGQRTELDSFNLKREKKLQHGMLVLSSWAAANIAGGLALGSTTSGEAKYFHKMNAYFNVVNLALGQLSYWGSRKNEGKKMTLAGSVRTQNGIEKTFLFNAGFDGVYMLGGLYLHERANRHTGKKRDQFRGYGNSLILQGGALLLFDGIMYHIQSKHGRWLNRKLSGVELTAGAGHAGLTWNF
jgi:hypothetical protein